MVKARRKRGTGDDLGIDVPVRRAAVPLSVRIADDDLRKLTKLGDRVGVGPSTMARLILEKFIKEHDPDR
jgi:hypothetical protein